MEPIFLKPVLQEKVWGGNKLYTEYGLELPKDAKTDAIGEAWCISAHPHGVSTVISPSQYKGIGLDELYQKEPQLFGKNETDGRFPLLTKILDAKENLSVQVHPDDTYAQEHEGELGKTECWYIMSAEPNAKIIYGHHAKTPEEFLDKVNQKDWKNLLVEVPVKAGDFFYVPHGTIHAIGEGIVILETQQNSDTTYRVYDYDRVDDKGNARDLHIQQSIDVTQFPDKKPELNTRIKEYPKATVTTYVDNHFFKVEKWEVNDELECQLGQNYYLATVISGQGELNFGDAVYPLHTADSFILPYGVKNVRFTGKLELIVSNTPL
ncbi:mannose-6-phosphate isomerase, class I [Granulicatella sp. 19428wC4_WM01]|nr:mannose-6-phosphate isomerase, class I [Granulicatella sp. 19428wC4_WM01]TFU96423.1 mannose-6-phosphate isomerase, class I [Granulicatella sp. WM01]